MKQNTCSYPAMETFRIYSKFMSLVFACKVPMPNTHKKHILCVSDIQATRSINKRVRNHAARGNV
jgi:hypothetical protein